MSQEPFIVVNRDSVPAFTTLDGSTIREILAPNNTGGIVRRQSLAEATLQSGQATAPHCHPVTEEIYYILQGTGIMQIGDTARTVSVGDGIVIPAGASHTIKNTASIPLVFLCCCSPAYTHADTIMVEMPEICTSD